MIDGFRIGHRTADGRDPGGRSWRTGSTVVLCDRPGAVGGVDVRGGGPGTRETDLLAPGTLVERADAVLLTGGSAYGLAAADGVMGWLEEQGRGFPVGPTADQVVPIVPAAVIYDLGRGGDFGARPDASFGREAVLAAAASDGADPAVGSVGVGTGARCGGLAGGFGWAEATLSDGGSVGAAVVVNAVGSAVDPRTGRLWSDLRGRLTDPTPAERDAVVAASGRSGASLATTLGVVLTDATLTPAEAGKVAAVSHDGLARAVVPVHGMSDGDTIFCLASGRRPAPADRWASIRSVDELLAVAAAVFTDACRIALTSAADRPGAPSYPSLAPSVVNRQEG